MEQPSYQTEPSSEAATGSEAEVAQQEHTMRLLIQAENARDALYRGNTLLIEALMDMVGQRFYERDGVYSHSFMSSDEQAIEVLMQAGYAEEVEPGKNGYRLLWDKVEARKDQPKPMTWAEAVNKYITDADVRAKLLAMDDEPATGSQP